MNVAFLGNRQTVLYAIAFVDNWHWWGFLVVLYLAAMQAVTWSCTRRRAWREPPLAGVALRYPARHHATLVFTILMTVIWSFLVFDYIYL